MAMSAPEWHEPRSLDEALSLRAEHGEEATVVAGGSFLGIVITRSSSPRRGSSPSAASPTRLYRGRWRKVNARGDDHPPGRRALARREEGWPSLAFTFSVVASPRVRNQATVGGVVADADYASDPLDACGP